MKGLFAVQLFFLLSLCVAANDKVGVLGRPLSRKALQQRRRELAKLRGSAETKSAPSRRRLGMLSLMCLVARVTCFTSVYATDCV